ncbi:MAG: phenylacetate--CoA ligase family protein [Bryobacteraceae bacterium]|jgi:phenylacetate-CoA ligase
MGLYPQVLQRLFLPLYYGIRGRHYARYRRLLEQSQWQPRTEVLAFQWRKLSCLLDHVFAHVPYYRQKYAAAGIQRGDIRGLADFSRLPVLTRDEIRVHREDLCAANVAQLLPHATGGSSGVPTRFYITRDSYDWRTAAAHRAYSWSGCGLGELTLYLWGAPIGAPPRWKLAKVHAFNALQRQEIVSTFSQSPALWQRVYAWHCRRRPALIVGYVSSLEAYAEYLAAQSLTPPPPRAVISAAEPLAAATRRRVEASLAAPVYNTYGSREFMSVAAECSAHAGLHIHAENLVVETALPAAAGASDILITDLHNYGMPFVRYAIGDMGVLDDSPCECGRGLPRIRSIEGRTLEVLRTPDGRVVPGEIFPHLMKEFPEIREFQARQLALDHIVISAVLDQPLSAAHRELMESELRKVFGPGLRIDLERLDTIPPLASGKRRVTIGLGG